MIHPVLSLRLFAHFRQRIGNGSMSNLNNTIRLRVICRRHNLLDREPLSKFIGQLLVLWSSVNNQTLEHAMTTDNLLPKELGDLFTATIRNSACFNPAAEVASSFDKVVLSSGWS